MRMEDFSSLVRWKLLIEDVSRADRALKDLEDLRSKKSLSVEYLLRADRALKDLEDLRCMLLIEGLSREQIKDIKADIRCMLLIEDVSREQIKDIKADIRFTSLKDVDDLRPLRELDVPITDYTCVFDRLSEELSCQYRKELISMIKPYLNADTSEKEKMKEKVLSSVALKFASLFIEDVSNSSFFINSMIFDKHKDMQQDILAFLIDPNVNVRQIQLLFLLCLLLCASYSLLYVAAIIIDSMVHKELLPYLTDSDVNRLCTVIIEFSLIRSQIEINPGPITSVLYKDHIRLLMHAKDKIYVYNLTPIQQTQFLRDAFETIINVYKCLGYEKRFHDLKNTRKPNPNNQQKEYYLDHKWVIDKELNLKYFVWDRKQREYVGDLIDQLIYWRRNFPPGFINTSDSRDMLLESETNSQEIPKRIRPIVESSYHLMKCILQERIRNQNNQRQEEEIKEEMIQCNCKECEISNIKGNMPEVLNLIIDNNNRERLSTLNRIVEEMRKAMSSNTENHTISSSISRQEQHMHYYDGGETTSITENCSISSPTVGHMHYGGGRRGEHREFGGAQVMVENQHRNGKDRCAGHRRGSSYHPYY